jgi:hypothetical protein
MQQWFINLSLCATEPSKYIFGSLNLSNDVPQIHVSHVSTSLPVRHGKHGQWPSGSTCHPCNSSNLPFTTICTGPSSLIVVTTREHPPSVTESCIQREWWMREEKHNLNDMWIPWVRVINIIMPCQTLRIDMANMDPSCTLDKFSDPVIHFQSS